MTLQGSNAGLNIFTGPIVDSSGGATNLTKAGVGLWVLGGSNTYSGATTVNAGTLQVGRRRRPTHDTA